NSSSYFAILSPLYFYAEVSRKMGSYHSLFLIIILLIIFIILFLPIIILIVHIIKKVNILHIFLSIDPLLIFNTLVIFVGIIIILLRESVYREIRSLNSVEHIIFNFPDLCESEFNFFIKATRHDILFQDYGLFLSSFFSNQYQILFNKYKDYKYTQNDIDTKLGLIVQFNNYLDFSQKTIKWQNSHIDGKLRSKWAFRIIKEKERRRTIKKFRKILLKSHS
ncbi:MAG: hypothetical protein ABUK01_12235, partial [Leptospirales bacterium]